MMLRQNLVSPEKWLVGTIAMDDEQLKMIKALTIKRQTHGLDPIDRTKIFKADQIKGKGEGRVILLHGSPGLGKTYTVECIAEYTGTSPTDT
jgi:hypothetical protein